MTMETFFVILEALCSIFLILVVLMQSGKEAGLSGALAGNSDSYMSKNKADSTDAKLASATKWLAAAWAILTLVLSLI